MINKMGVMEWLVQELKKQKDIKSVQYQHLMGLIEKMKEVYEGIETYIDWTYDGVDDEE